MSTPTVDLVETMIDAATEALRTSGVIQHGRSVESVRVATLVALDAGGFLGLVELLERGESR